MLHARPVTASRVDSQLSFAARGSRVAIVAASRSVTRNYCLRKELSKANPMRNISQATIEIISSRYLSVSRSCGQLALYYASGSRKPPITEQLSRKNRFLQSYNIKKRFIKLSAASCDESVAARNFCQWWAKVFFGRFLTQRSLCKNCWKDFLYDV